MTATTPTESEIRAFLEEAFRGDNRGESRCSRPYLLLDELTGDLLGHLRHDFWRLDDSHEADIIGTMDRAMLTAQEQARELIIDALTQAGAEFARRQPRAPLVPQKAA